MPTQIQKNSSAISTTLNSDNYYDVATDWPYQSKSWFWKFMQCEAEALAELKGDWSPNRNAVPLLVGNYLHSYFESPEAHEQFVQENQKQMFKYGNPEKGLKSEFKQAEKMINTLEHDDNFNALYQGEKEVPVTGELFGIKWKGKIDCLDLDRKIFLDLKTVDDIHKKHWSEKLRSYVSFAEARGYDMQMAIYQKLIEQTYGVRCEPFIIAVSKQDIPDKGIYSIPDYLMDGALQAINTNQPHIQAVKEGLEKPVACGHCDYCRADKKLDEIVPIDQIKFY